MKMLKIKYGKSTCQYRLDWLVSWGLIYTEQKNKNPEKWEIVLFFVEPGHYKHNKTGSNARMQKQVSFEFATEAEAMAAVSIVDI